MTRSFEGLGVGVRAPTGRAIDYVSELRGDYEKEFARLTEKYNYPDRYIGDVFVDLLTAAIRERIRPSVLDVGCGEGIFGSRRYQKKLRPHIGRFVGVEPDRKVPVNREIFDTVHADSMESAPIPAASIDIAYAAMVAEHVVHPEAFLRAVERCLRPGGILLICTPNARTYFGRVCSVARFLGIEDWLLRQIRGSESVDEYHYPTTYRMNTAADLRSIAQRVGLKADVGYTESETANREYFPALLRPLWSAFKLKRRLWRNPRALDHIVAVIEKPR